MHSTCTTNDESWLGAERGFTLIELVVVVLVLSVVVGMTATLTIKPLQAYGDVRLRTALTNSAEAATRRIRREIRSALPNSVRVSADGRKLELIHVVDGARYRAEAGVNPVPSSADHTADTDWIDFTAQDGSFNILGRFQQLGLGYGVASPAGYRIAIYPTETSTYADAESPVTSPSVITSGAAGVFQLANDGDEDQIQIAGGSEMQFPLSSPRQRVYIVDTAISYICDLGAQTLTRYWSYAIESTQPEDPTVSPLVGGNAARLANDVAACDFRYSTPTATHSGLVTLDLTVSRGGEQARLLQQVHVGNTP
jgi:MSHA biogenesis protein MshO